MDDEIENIAGINAITPLARPFSGNDVQPLSSTNPNRFLEQEPTFFSSRDIGKYFFEGISEQKFWPKKNMSVYNEGGITIPWAQYVVPAMARPKRPIVAGDRGATPRSNSSQEPTLEIQAPTVTITAKGYQQTPYFKVFVSDDGDKLNYLANHATNGKPAANEVLIFIESDEDTFTGKFFKMRAGSGIQLGEESLSTILKAFTNASSDEIGELMGAIYRGEVSFGEQMLNFLLDGIDYLYNLPFKLLSYLLGKAMSGLEYIRIKESFWNPDKKEEGKLNIKDIFDDILSGIKSGISTIKSIVEKINGIVGGTLDIVVDLLDYCEEVIEKIYKVVSGYLMVQIASFVGIWNGLVDLVLGILFLFKLVIDARNLAFSSVKGLAQDQARGELEAFDNFIKSFSFSDVVAAFDTAYDNLVELISEIDFDVILSNLGKTARKAGVAIVDALSLSIYEIAYYIGYIATFFIPFAWIVNILGKLGKVGQLAGKAFLFVDEIMARIFGSVFKLLGKGGQGVVKGARGVAGFLRLFTKEFNRLGAGQLFRQVVDDLFKGVRKWLDELFPGWRTPEAQMDQLLRQVDDLFDDFGGRLLTEKELRLLKVKLRDLYGVRLRMVDKDHSLTKLLEDWNKRKVVGRFDPGPPPTMFLRSNNASDLTVFHEIVHLEVWLKRLPKMHIWQEEKYVFDAIYREWKKNPGRWTNDEIIDSYRYVNLIAKRWNKKGKNFPSVRKDDIEELIWNQTLGIR